MVKDLENEKESCMERVKQLEKKNEKHMEIIKCLEKENYIYRAREKYFMYILLLSWFTMLLVSCVALVKWVYSLRHVCQNFKLTIMYVNN
jgi:membrane protein insertase Oxa1/YidC/SpoIIIJ